jgi:hypothetical protein
MIIVNTEDKSTEQCMVAYAAEAQPAKPTHGGTASMLTFCAKR